MSLHAKLYITAIVAGGLACFGYGMAQWTCRNPFSFVCLLGLALGTSLFNVKVPGTPTNLSVSFILVLMSILDFSYAETLVVGCLAAGVQSVWRKNHQSAIQLLFNLSSVAIAVWVGYELHHRLVTTLSLPASITIAAMAYYLTNTVSISAVVGLTTSTSIYKTWHDCHFWLFPYYLMGVAIALLASWGNRRFGWETSVLALPAAYMLFHSYRLYLERLGRQRDHALEIASLHLRTIEALALAIEAKDDTTHGHLERVQIYATELGNKIGLSDSESQALRAASILHDIGKLAVPEHIISKPGKLTPEEFEKMKIHPTVGAEILERVQFPYEVVPIVRSHHEKWDGSGYPAGIKGEEIPIGARILAAVDCLDALASDRQYRRALPLDEAMAVVVSEAGRSFDPRVVKVLSENYREWERMATSTKPPVSRLSKDVAVSNGNAPAAGFQSSGQTRPQPPDFLSSIAAARQEVQTLYELTQDLGSSLNLHETLSVLDSRLKRLIPYDTIAVYLCEEGHLIPKYVNGENFRLFSSLNIPIGQGLSGWVADTAKPIINGNPSVEPGYLDDPTKFSTLRSALAAPLHDARGVIGVLALYSLELDAFTKDHLRVLLAVNPKVSLSIENAVKYQQVAISATTDALTSLPNAKSLFMHLDSELARSRRDNKPLAVLVCDLDGFKQINDRFGHLEGNRILKLVSAGMRECCREYDYVGRMGGDEFVLIMPGIEPQDIPGKIAALESVVVNAGLTVCGERLLNISVGAAFCPENGHETEGLLAEADRRMYLAKRVRRTPVPFAARTGAWDNLSHGDKVSRRVPDPDLQTSHLALAVKLH